MSKKICNLCINEAECSKTITSYGGCMGSMGMHFEPKCCANCAWSQTYGAPAVMECNRVSGGIRDNCEVEPADYCSMCGKPKEE